MRDCWLDEPGMRPTFAELAEKIGEELEEGEQEHYLVLNKPYEEENEVRQRKYVYLAGGGGGEVDDGGGGLGGGGGDGVEGGGGEGNLERERRGEEKKRSGVPEEIPMLTTNTGTTTVL